jgi:hypothetical protein
MAGIYQRLRPLQGNSLKQTTYYGRKSGNNHIPARSLSGVCRAAGKAEVKSRHPEKKNENE